jgi:hypothetical protein
VVVVVEELRLVALGQLAVVLVAVAVEITQYKLAELAPLIKVSLVAMVHLLISVAVAVAVLVKSVMLRMLMVKLMVETVSRVLLQERPFTTLVAVVAVTNPALEG